MKFPFTAEQFLDVFGQYNEAVYPMQFVLYLVAGTAIYLAIKTTSSSDKIISLILAFLWLWMGLVYHLLFFSSINKMAYFFGAVGCSSFLACCSIGFHLDSIMIFTDGVA